MCDRDKIVLAIVDDHPMILEGLKSLFQREGSRYQLFCFTKGEALLDFIQENRVDVVLLDIVLHDGSGLDFCKAIKQKSIHTRVLGISNQEERSIIFRFLENGGSGYILKNADAMEIVSCVEKALHGELALSKQVAEIMLSPVFIPVELPRLTKREQQVLQAISNGLTSAEIANQLFISVITVETHRRNLLQKFKAKNMFELIKIATTHKLI